MRLKNILLATSIALAIPSAASAQTVSNGYTVLQGYSSQDYNHWVDIVQSELDAGYQFYRNYVLINSEGAERIVNTLGPYFSYVYGPSHHDVPVYLSGTYTCVYVFNYDPRTNTAGSGTQFCGYF